MKKAIASLESIAVYSQSKYYKTPRLEKELHEDYERRTWRDRLHVNYDGYVFIPPMAFKNCIAEAAQYLSIKIPGKGSEKYTKHFRAGILVVEGLILPIKKDEVDGEWILGSSKGIRGGSQRVEKCFPVIPKWKGDVTFTIMDDIITPEIFKYCLEEAGNLIGIGTFRPANGGYYGRFKVNKIKWL